MPWAWAITALALALRLFYLFDLKETPFFEVPQMDAAFHHEWAQDLSQGNWWGSEVFFRAPGYPYFLGVLYTLGLNALGVRLVQMLIGALTVFLTMRFMLPRFGATPAYVAGMLLALCGPLIYFEGELLLVVLEAPLFLVTLWSWVRAREHPESLKRWGVAGIVLGCASLVRPIGLILVPFLATDEIRRRRGAGLKSVLVYAVGLLLILSPVLVRNYVVGRDIVPVASQGGWNFYIGNHQGSDGRAALAEGFRRDWKGGIEDMEFEAERAWGRQLKPSEVSRYWYGQAWGWAREHPGTFGLHQVKKLGYFWDGFELPNNQDYYFFSKMTRLFHGPLVSFGLIGPLALLGLALGLWRREMSFPLSMLPLLLMAVVVAFFICGRFRASLMPLFAIWSGMGVGWMILMARRRDWKPLGLFVGVFVLMAGFANGDVHGFRSRHNQAESHFRLGVFYGAQGESSRAEANYRQALDLTPGFGEAWNNLGILYAQGENLSGARSAFERALAIDPQHIKTRSNLAALEFREGNRGRALEHARAVDNQMTYDAVALYNAAVVFGNLGDIESARRLFKRILGERPTHAQARLGLARAYLALGDEGAAQGVLEELRKEDRSPEMEHLLEQLRAH